MKSAADSGQPARKRRSKFSDGPPTPTPAPSTLPIPMPLPVSVPMPVLPSSSNEETTAKKIFKKKVEENYCDHREVAVESRAGFGFSAPCSSSSSIEKPSTALFVKASTGPVPVPVPAPTPPPSNSSDFAGKMKEAAERAKQIASRLAATSGGGQMKRTEKLTPTHQQQQQNAFKKISSVARGSNSGGGGGGGVDFDSMTDEQKKQYIEQKELQELYETMTSKRSEIQSMASKISKKRDYDSDEEIDDEGTWEHKLRKAESEATQEWAIKLTNLGQGKHHIGDFLPPTELKKFMETFKALKQGRLILEQKGDYEEFKLKEENLGFKLLKKLGWTEGKGLGSTGQGILNPIDKGSTSFENTGVGVEKVEALTKDDSEFDMYRKRMMLAYKFRPNPMNNPRRSYY